ncbi:hypothetical protein [Saccharopolyspora antimicrobica]|nr:hypothetical protein [Saccharopolyspora antimicrobica]
MSERPDLVLRHDPFLPPSEHELRTRLEVRLPEPQPDLRLRIRLRLAKRVRLVRRIDPPAFDDEAVRRTAGHIEVPLGDWSGTREYEIGFELGPGPQEEDLQAALVDLVRGEFARAVGPARAVKVHWTADPGAASLSRVRSDLVDALWSGCEAYESGDLAQAELRWQEARTLARHSGDDDSVQRLNRLVAGRQVRAEDVIEAGRTPGRWP